MEDDKRFKMKEINFEGYVESITRANEESTKTFEKVMDEWEEKFKKMFFVLCEGEKKINSENGEKGVEGDKRCKEGYVLSLTRAFDKRKEKNEEEYKKIREEREKREDENEEKYMKRLMALSEGERKVNNENGEKGVEGEKRFDESYVFSITNAHDESKVRLEKMEEEYKKIIDERKKREDKREEKFKKRLMAWCEGEEKVNNEIINVKVSSEKFLKKINKRCEARKKQTRKADKKTNGIKKEKKVKREKNKKKKSAIKVKKEKAGKEKRD